MRRRSSLLTLICVLSLTWPKSQFTVSTASYNVSPRWKSPTLDDTWRPLQDALSSLKELKLKNDFKSPIWKNSAAFYGINTQATPVKSTNASFNVHYGSGASGFYAELSRRLQEDCVLWNSSCRGNQTAALLDFFGSRSSNGNHSLQHLLKVNPLTCFRIFEGIPEESSESCPPDAIQSQYPEIKSWMRNKSCAIARNNWLDTGVLAPPYCCGYCQQPEIPLVEVIYWPDPDAETSCLSIVGTGQYPIDYGATTDVRGPSDTVTYWGCVGPDPRFYHPSNYTPIDTIWMETLRTFNGGLANRIALADPWASPDICPQSTSTSPNFTFTSNWTSVLPNQLPYKRNFSDQPAMTTTYAGHMLKYPSIYVFITSATYGDNCGLATITSTMLTYASGQLSSYAFDTDMKTLILKSFDLRDLPCPPEQVMRENWYKPAPGRPYHPVIEWPPQLSSIFPDLAQCATFLEAYDPFRALTPQPALASPDASAPTEGGNAVSRVTANGDIVETPKPGKIPMPMLVEPTSQPKPSKNVGENPELFQIGPGGPHEYFRTSIDTHVSGAIPVSPFADVASSIGPLQNVHKGPASDPIKQPPPVEADQSTLLESTKPLASPNGVGVNAAAINPAAGVTPSDRGRKAYSSADPGNRASVPMGAQDSSGGNGVYIPTESTRFAQPTSQTASTQSSPHLDDSPYPIDRLADAPHNGVPQASSPSTTNLPFSKPNDVSPGEFAHFKDALRPAGTNSQSNSPSNPQSTADSKLSSEIQQTFVSSSYRQQGSGSPTVSPNRLVLSPIKPSSDNVVSVRGSETFTIPVSAIPDIMTRTANTDPSPDHTAIPGNENGDVVGIPDSLTLSPIRTISDKVVAVYGSETFTAAIVTSSGIFPDVMATDSHSDYDTAGSNDNDETSEAQGYISPNHSRPSPVLKLLSDKVLAVISSQILTVPVTAASDFLADALATNPVFHNNSIQTGRDGSNLSVLPISAPDGLILNASVTKAGDNFLAIYNSNTLTLPVPTSFDSPISNEASSQFTAQDPISSDGRESQLSLTSLISTSFDLSFVSSQDERKPTGHISHATHTSGAASSYAHRWRLGKLLGMDNAYTIGAILAYHLSI